jgi:hypothetical protein
MSKTYWMPSELNELSEATPIHDLFDVPRDIDHSLAGPPEHVVNLDPGWTHVESFFCTRETLIEEKEELEGPLKLSPQNLVTQSKVVSLALCLSLSLSH